MNTTLGRSLSRVRQAEQELDAIGVRFWDAWNHRIAFLERAYAEQYIQKRLAICRLIEPRSEAELRVLEERIRSQFRMPVRKVNHCWSCGRQVGYSEYCPECGWFLCSCGCCQSPCPPSGGFRGHPDPVCKYQILRLGHEEYERRVTGWRYPRGYV
jgi:hypothetical protein